MPMQPIFFTLSMKVCFLSSRVPPNFLFSGSAKAYKQLAILDARGTPASEDLNSSTDQAQSDQVDFDAAKVVAEYDLSLEKVHNF